MMATQRGHKSKIKQGYYMADYARMKGRGSKKRNELKKSLNNNTFTALRHDVINSTEFNNLSLSAKWVFIKLLTLYNRSNNGCLSMPQTKEQAEKLGMSDRTLKNAIKELLETRFIEMTRQGGKNQCSLYAVTCFPLNEINQNGITLKATQSPSDKWKS